MAHRSWVKCLSSSHAPSLLDYYDMSSPHSNMQFHSAPSLGSASHEIARVLLNVVAGVGEGWLQDIPWQALPLTYSFVMERLALAAFSTCSCSSLSALWYSNLDSGTILTPKAHSGNLERSTVLGCHCMGWKEGAMGTLVCKERQEGSSLQQELIVLSYILSGLSAKN